MDSEIKYIQDILSKENNLVLKWEEKYGKIYPLCLKINTLLSSCFLEYNEEYLNFYILTSQIKKHYLLSILSLVRLHKTESFLNSRIVIEGIFQSIYSIDNRHLWALKLDGIFNSQKKSEFYTYFKENYPEKSSFYKEQKALINKNFAHSWFTLSFLNSKYTDNNVTYSFFDKDLIKEHTAFLHMISDIWIFYLIWLQEKNLSHRINLSLDFDKILWEIIIEKWKIIKVI